MVRMLKLAEESVKENVGVFPMRAQYFRDINYQVVEEERHMELLVEQEHLAVLLKSFQTKIEVLTGRLEAEEVKHLEKDKLEKERESVSGGESGPEGGKLWSD